MKSKAVALGHPIHPMLIPFPLAFLTGALAFDLGGSLLDRPQWWTTGGHLAAMGVLTALAAAVPGLVDYLYTVPPKSSGKTRATRHMLANLSAVGLFALAWWFRGGAAQRPDPLIILVEIVAFMLLVSGAYMGGTLVTRNLISVDHRYAHAGKWRDDEFPALDDGGLTVAQPGDLKVDQMKLLRVGGKRIVLARTEHGYVAFDDRCTHRGGSLAGGVMICGTVQCLWHGSQFDAATGRVKAGPAVDPIKVYRIVEEQGQIKLFR